VKIENVDLGYITVTMNNTFVLNFRMSYHAIMASDTP